MKKYFLIIFIFSLSYFSSTYGKVCVLALFPNDSKEMDKVNLIFKNYSRARIFSAANFDQIKHCFKSEEYREILWLSHGTIGGLITPFSAPVFYSQKDNSKHIIYKRFFEILANSLNRSLKLRVAFCGAGINGLNSSIDPLVDKIRNLSGEVEFSPNIELLSKLYTKPVTDLSLSWLSKSLDPLIITKWKTSESLHCNRASKRPCMKICTKENTAVCSKKSAKYIIPLKTTQTE
ncbi:MAG: hypothetical protein QF441_08145 [Bacteriovoracaceae bacterium]|jgi:hypothetical protein|nr:hypothetical protein [Bacteriovoracaceae bacterium]